MRRISRQQWAWACYDTGNSAFATSVMAGFFPVFFKEYWAQGLSSEASTFWLGLGSSIASLLVVFMAPLLGAIADGGGLKRRFLGWFTALGVLSTAALYLLGQGQWLAALTLFVLGSLGFQAGVGFYDALLMNVAAESELDRVSALGYGLGYLGGGVLLALNVAMVLQPTWFGLADAVMATRVAFLSVALWWGVFALPLFFSVQEGRRRTPRGWRATAIAGGTELWATLQKLRSYRPVWMFLLAYWLYIDGVDTIVRMAVDYGLTLGFPASSLMIALLMVQLIGFPAAIAFGVVGERLGARKGLYIGLGVYIAVTAWAYQLTALWQFFVMAAVIGLVQGGIQALSRSYFARLIPPAHAGEFFGFYNMLGKFAAVLGPVAVGVTKLITGDARLAILVLLVFFIGGMLLLSRVDRVEPHATA